jgi:SAM-dependent methyltransferase
MAITPDYQPILPQTDLVDEQVAAFVGEIDAISQQEVLRRELRLDLTDHELKDPKTTIGTVSSVIECDPISYDKNEALPTGVRVFEIRVKDAYVEADPESYWLISRYVDHIEGMMRQNGFDPLVDTRSEASNESEWNPITAGWLADPNVEALKAWRNKVPNGDALGDIYDIPVGKQIGVAEDGRPLLASKEAAAQLRFVDDAVGIRDRRTAMMEIVSAYLPGIPLEDKTLRWLSLASGTADPSIRAINRAREEYGITPKLIVADIDRDSLEQVAANAQKGGIADNEIKTVRANILSSRLRQYLELKANFDGADVVENLGFEEYLPQDGDEIAAKKGVGLPEASEFTRNAYELVRPGGILLSGNMVHDRPQTNYVFGAVDWPIINARYEKEIMRVYDQAGILDDPQADVAMFRIVNDTTQAHLYNIVVVHKKPEVSADA